MSELYICPDGNYEVFKNLMIRYSDSSVMLICGKSFERFPIADFLYNCAKKNNVNIIRFDNFKPNPDYSSIAAGTELFNEKKCRAIIAVGGGSAIDTAKCIKMFSNMDSNTEYIYQPVLPNDIELTAVPTTAGSGSEATEFAVIYYNGEKISVKDESCIPGSVILIPGLLETLPDYHRKASVLDALCHSVESFWSVNSTDESKEYSRKAIRLIYENSEKYLANDAEGNRIMLEAAHIAGKAINIAQTTAGHAMCYKLTTLYGLAHGYAAAMCTERLWSYMLSIAEMKPVFEQLAEVSGVSTPEMAFNKFSSFVSGLIPSVRFDKKYIELLADSVNPERLKNNPVIPERGTIKDMYKDIFEKYCEKE